MQKAASKKPVRGRESAAPVQPVLDINSVIEKLKLPGVDVPSLVESRRKDVEALLDANEKAYEAIETLNRRQANLLAASLKEWNDGARELLTSGNAQTAASRTATRVQQAVSQAMYGMRELAELAAKSYEEVADILNKRANCGLEEFRLSLKKAA